MADLRFPSPADQALATRLLAAGQVTREQLEALRREQARRGGPELAPLASLLPRPGRAPSPLTPGLASETPVVLVEQPGADTAATTVDRGAPPIPLPAEGLPRTLGRYVCREVLGRGGMGVVYLARDPELVRDVALKTILLPPDEDRDSAERRRKRFVQEARATARLRHPHIVTLHEVGEHEGTPFVVMDYVKGEPLEDLLRRENRLAPRRAAEIVREVALALHHAHEQGIVHRDVKPSNVLLDEQGRVHLTDFGLARDVNREETQITLSGQLVGTPVYISPEQARGQHKQTDGRSDVFSLGGVLYRSLTGVLPFPGVALADIVRRVLMDDPVPPRQRDKSIHPDLETIALRCLEKEPDRRYPSAAAVARELERFLAGEAISMRPMGWRERAGRWARRNRGQAITLLASGVLVLGLLGVGVWGALWSVRQIRAERDQARAERGRAEEERVRARAAEESARAAAAEAEARSHEKDAMIARALRERGERLLAERRVPEAAAVLARSLEVLESPATRETLAEALPHLPRAAWSSPRGAVRALALAPDGSWLAAGDSEGRLVFLRPGPDGALSPAREVAQAHRGWVLCASFRPDGGELATGGQDGEVRRWSPAGQCLEVMRAHTGPVTGVAWGEGGRLVSAGVDGVVRAWTPGRGGQGQALLPGPGSPVLALASAPGGGLVAAATEDGRALLWSLPDGSPAGELRGHEGPVMALAFDARGARLVTGGADRTARVWDLNGQRALAVHRLGAAVSAVAALPARDEVLAATLSGEVFLRPAAESAAAVLVHPAELLALVVAPDGRRLVVSGLDGELRERALGAGDARGRALASLRDSLRRVAWRADGQRLAAAGGALVVCEATTGETRGRAGLQGQVRALGFGPDGEPLLVLEGGAEGPGRRVLPAPPTGGAWLATGVNADGAALALGLERPAPGGEGQTPPPPELVLARLERGAPAPARLPLAEDEAPALAALGPQGQAALLDPAGRLLLWRPGPGPGTTARATTAGADALRLEFSPDGRRLLLRQRQGLRVLDADDGRELLALPLEPGAPGDPLCASPDGRLLAVGWSRERRVEVWDLERGTCRLRLPWDEPPRELAFAPAAPRLAVAGGRVRLIELPAPAPGGAAAAEPREERPGALLPLPAGGWLHADEAGTLTRVGPEGRAAPAWRGAPAHHLLAARSDGRQVLARGADLERGDVRLLDLAAGKELARFDLGPGWTGTLGPAGLRAGWSPDGRHLLLTRVDEAPGAAVPDGPEATLLLEVASARTAFHLRVAPAPGPEPDPPQELPVPAFRPDGAVLAVVEQRAPRLVRLLQAPSGRALAARLHPERVTALAFDAAGRLATATGRTASVRLWEPEREEPHLLHERLGCRVLALAFGPGGRWLGALEDAPGQPEAERLRLRLFDLERRGELASLPLALPPPRRSCEASLSLDGPRLIASSRGRALALDVEALGLTVEPGDLVQRVWAETGLCLVGLDPVHAPGAIERLLLAGEW